MKSLKKTYEIDASPEEVFKALTDPKLISEWSGSHAIMSSRKGASFKLWDGTIYGKNTEVVENKKIVQDWFSTEEGWKEAIEANTPSKVTFEISDNEDGTSTVNLTHEDIPDSELDNIALGWDEYYMWPLTDMLK